MSGKRLPQIGIRFRIDFAERCSLGPGKIELLESIRRTGSLSHAATELGMSYRRAWLLAADLNRSFRTPVITASTGGRGGGGASLTPLGVRLITLYRTFERHLARSAVRRLAALGPLTRAPAGGRQRHPIPRGKSRGAARRALPRR